MLTHVHTKTDMLFNKLERIFHPVVSLFIWLMKVDAESQRSSLSAVWNHVRDSNRNLWINETAFDIWSL